MIPPSLSGSMFFPLKSMTGLQREVGQMDGACDISPSGSLIVLSKSKLDSPEVRQLPALARGSDFSPAGSMVVLLESMQ
jgi:hypothetical protein